MKTTTSHPLTTLLFLISLASLIPSAASANLVTFLWEETGNDVRVTLSGSFDVTGWTVSSSNTNGASRMNFRNYIEEDPDYPPEVYQSLQINSQTTGGIIGGNSIGVLHLSPWKTPTNITYAEASGISGSFGGQISIRNDTYNNPSVWVGQNGVIDGVYAVDAVLVFTNMTLAALFGDGLDDWATGAHIVSYGSNEVWFTTTMIPEPYVSGLFVGVGACAWVLFRRRRRQP